MTASFFVLLVIISSALVIHSRPSTNADQLIPLLLSSVTNAEDNGPTPSLTHHHRLLSIVEIIIKYVSKIRSSEKFIDSIINRQGELADRMKVLLFLSKCFQITDTVIQREISRLSDPSHMHHASEPASTLMIEELQRAQHKIDNLLDTIEQRIASLKTWIPPTVPFLGF